MIKVCILTSVHPPFDVRIFHKEAKSLVKNGYKVTLVAQHDKNEIVNGVQIVSLQMPRSRIVRMTKTAWTLYRKAVYINADIYHLHDPELLPIGLLLRLQGKKIIYDMHENLPKQIKNKDWINPKLRCILSAIIYLAERIIFVDMPVIFAEHSYRKDYPWVKISETILNMPLENQLLAFKSDQLIKKKHVIGYIGGVTAERGSFVTIEAIKRLKDNGITLRYECVGPITESHKHELIRKCDEYNISDITIHGYLPADQGWQIIRHCNVGLALLHPIPNYIESYPTKVFEYMAMKIPVITSNFPLYREIIEGNDCGICVDALDPTAIAKAIYYLVMNPEIARCMGENGYKAVLNKYNWSIEERKFCAFYSGLV